MAYKITQCIIPFVHQNRQTFIQVFITSPNSNAKKSFSTETNNAEKDVLPRNFEITNHIFRKNYSTNQDPCVSKKETQQHKKNLCGGTNGEGENLAAVLHGIKDIRMEKRPVPQIKPNQVLLQMEVCGICGSDVHFYEDGKIGPFVVKKPMIIGHEASGTVVKVGEKVKTLKAGDKVAIEPQTTCRVCKWCKLGLYHMCPCVYFCATPPDDGNLSRFFAHDEDFCHKLPCNLDHEIGTLLEPLAVAVHGCKKGCITCGDKVLVTGSGPIGLASLLVAKAYGASHVIVLDIDDWKLKKAMEMGADCAMNVKGMSEEEVVKKVIEMTGERPNKTLECCGFEHAMRTGILATATCGKMVLLGIGPDNQNIPIMEPIYREIDILGSLRYANDYPTAIDMVATGKFNPKPFITHHFKLEDAPKAFELASKKQEKYIKIMIHANPDWKPAEDQNKKC